VERIPTDIVVLQRSVAFERDQRAYQRLFVHFYQPLVKFANNIVKSTEAAEEIYSDVLLKLWDMGPALAAIGHLEVYLFRSVKNASLNYLSRYYKVPVVDLDTIHLEMIHEVYTPEQNLLRAELHKKATLAVRSLPAKCQLVYTLIRDNNFSYKQVADIMDISVNTVEGHMSTALRKLGVMLQAYLPPTQN
jgi:RNA polymerase sigma-70 factor (family 1)